MSARVSDLFLGPLGGPIRAYMAFLRHLIGLSKASEDETRESQTMKDVHSKIVLLGVRGGRLGGHVGVMLGLTWYLKGI